MVAVIATFTVAEGKAEAFEAEFKILSDAVHANEPGVTLYTLVRAKKQPEIYKVMELYATKEDFKAHGASEWFQASLAKLKPLLANDPVIELFDPLF
jgi:quinol monooxygenase YgiN